MSVQAPSHRIVDSPTLQSLLSSDGHVVVLDVRPAYSSGHLPGAYAVDVEETVTVDDAAGVEASLRALGVDDDTLVVVYGDHKGIAAGRLAWTLEQSGHRHTALLDGGYDAWWRLGLPTTTETTPPARPGNVTLTAALPMACAESELAGFAARGQLVDVRTRTRFKAGHVPGAVNVPSTAFGDQAGRVLDAASTALRMRRSGVNPAVPFAVYCDDGAASAWVAYVTRRAGLDARLLVGGWNPEG